MLTRVYFGKLVRAVVILLMFFGNLVKTAPTERGVVRPASPHASDGALKSDAFLRLWFQTRTEDRAASETSTNGLKLDRSPGSDHHHHRPGPDHRRPGTHHKPGSGPVLDHRPGPSRREQILEMISALEEVHRSINSTLSSRLTFMTRASGRHPGKKHRLVAVSDKAAAAPKATTAPPAVSNSTVTHSNTVVPGRNLKKSLPPQHKKPNKRVCFWKYCSQN
ncbi:urotensin II-related peptide [Eucyclogobius newberryi]|uniref:urotensin II-related peptide n=1 Tax=Eucyclogobius newberryi TaxID=166745 RepID=UPI003B5A67AD